MLSIVSPEYKRGEGELVRLRFRRLWVGPLSFLATTASVEKSRRKVIIASKNNFPGGLSAK